MTPRETYIFYKIKNGVSIEDIAEKLGLSKSYVSALYTKGLKGIARRGGIVDTPVNMDIIDQIGDRFDTLINLGVKNPPSSLFGYMPAPEYGYEFKGSARVIYSAK